jgi:RNA polymerase sigma-70 factor (sigma-E family)
MGSFEEFVRDYADGLLRTAYLLTGSQQDAEDLVNDTLEKAQRKWLLIRRTDHPGAYARRMMINAFLSGRRRKRPAVSSPEAMEQLAEKGDPIAQVVDREYLRQGLLRLPDRERAAVVLKHYHQMNTREIAHEWGVAESTVRSTLSRGIQSLRATLSQA